MIDIDKEIKEAKRKIDQCINSYSSEGLKDNEGLTLFYQHGGFVKLYAGSKELNNVRSVSIRIDESTGFRPRLTIELLHNIFFAKKLSFGLDELLIQSNDDK